MKREVQIRHDAEEIDIVPYEYKAKYHETDRGGNIHYTNFIEWMEDARMDLMEQLGLGHKQMETMEMMSPVVSLSIEYRSDVKFDDVVVIDTKILKYDGHIMEVAYRMYDKESGEDRALARSKHCFVNKAGVPISLKRSYPELDTKFFEFK
ncbi:MAG: acyl-CoA thioesterase [Lachnospiraceae bacterium]|nr:acyl-CoA thioesterase [Lachnospiraceae bacterium]